MQSFRDDGRHGDAWVPGMDHTGGGKASQYHPRLGEIILGRLGQGETIREVCADPAMPSAATLHRWRHMHPEFGAAYERMRDARGAWRQQLAQIKREQWREWVRIEARTGRRRTRTWVAGRSSTYERGWAAAFCARVASGEAVYRICGQPGMPSLKAVYGWLRRWPEFVGMYAQAKRDAINRLVFQVDITADRALDEPMTAASVRDLKREIARLEARIGRLMPKTYR